MYDGSASGALYLDTPRQITDTGGNVVWEWQNTDPYGNNPPNENPSGQGTFNCNLGFTGQYRDKETNTFYNYFRDYDPATGRYLQSDPIGLGGGINTYTYVEGNPLSYVDPEGLAGGPPAPGAYYPPGSIPRPPSVSRNEGRAGNFDAAGEALDQLTDSAKRKPREKELVRVCRRMSCPNDPPPNQCPATPPRSNGPFIYSQGSNAMSACRCEEWGWELI